MWRSIVNAKYEWNIEVKEGSTHMNGVYGNISGICCQNSGVIIVGDEKKKGGFMYQQKSGWIHGLDIPSKKIYPVL